MAASSTFKIAITITRTPLSYNFRPNINLSTDTNIPTLNPNPNPNPTRFFPFTHSNRTRRSVSVYAETVDFSASFEPDGFGPHTDPTPPTEEPPCPPGLRKYETMAVLRPDMNEDERLALTHKYEELLVAGGGMYIEVFNRGLLPLAYGIKKKNRAGETNSYFDGIYLVFTYFTKPESINILEETLKADDNVIRTMTFKVRKRKY